MPSANAGTGKPLACLGKMSSIAETAFLVNESRARRQDISKDRFASLWVSEGARQLWKDYSANVYPHDDINISIRNRFFLDRLSTFALANPGCCIANIAAGFTSYPFLLGESLRYLEIDLPSVISFKEPKVRLWQAEGTLPPREVEFLPVDLNQRSDRLVLEKHLAEKFDSKPSAVLLEGILYYLTADTVAALFDILRKVLVPRSLVILNYWKPEVATHPVFRRLEDFFQKTLQIPSKTYNLFGEEFLRGIIGFKIGELAVPQNLERDYAGTSVLSSQDKVLPGNYCVLERTG